MGTDTAPPPRGTPSKTTWTPDRLAGLSARITERIAATRAQPISKIDLFLTEDCTLACDYCFVARKTPSHRMSWDTARRAVEFLVMASGDLTGIALHFMGGEPLLEFPLLARTTQYAARCSQEMGKAVQFAVTTNGTLLTEEIIRFGRAFGFNYLLSLDGDQDTHDRHRRTHGGDGSWRRVVDRALPLLRRHQGWIGTRMTVLPDTARDLCRGVQTLFALGVNQFLIGPDYDADWAPAELRALFAQMIAVARFYADAIAAGAPLRIVEFESPLEDRSRRMRPMWGCDAGVSRVAVSTAGGLYPCARFVRPFAGMPAFCMGTVDTGLARRDEWFRAVADARIARKRCLRCAHAALCAGGCPASNIHRNGSAGKPVLAACVYTAALRRALRIIYSVPAPLHSGTPAVDAHAR